MYALLTGVEIDAFFVSKFVPEGGGASYFVIDNLEFLSASSSHVLDCHP
jgi:hypothetical protein